jgi:predicted peptidase
MRYLGLLILLALSGSTATAQTGFLDRTILRGGETYRYQVYVPAEYTPKSVWPLIVSLHGNGAQGTDGMLQTGSNFAIRIREHRATFPAIVVFPQARPGTRWFYPEMEELVMAELQRTTSEFRIDTKRIYLHGFSMGATGGYRIALKWPTTFAAGVLVAGRIEDGPPYTPQEIEIDRRTNPFVAATDPFTVLAAGIRQIPIWVFHGDADERVPVEQSRRVVAALKHAGAAVRYTEYPGVDHNSAPAKAYAEADFLSWLFSQRR